MKGRELTVGMAFYCNPSMLQRHYDAFAGMSADVREKLTYSVVDDGSPDGEAFPPPEDCGFASRGWRMGVDRPWNQDACRNIIAHHCQTEWLLLTDMDHMVPEATLQWAMTAKLDPRTAYTFARVNDPKMEPYKPHPNSWLMTRDLYHLAGGYDERFAGVYGTDGMFKKRVIEQAYRGAVQVPHVLVRVPREVTPDASTTRYTRKSPEAAALKDEVTIRINASGDPEPKRLTFPYEMVWDRR